MRIDLLIGTADLAGRLKAAYTDRLARKGKDPSDHAPVIVDLDEAPDGDIGPVVPPPSLKAQVSGGPRRHPAQLRRERLRPLRKRRPQANCGATVDRQPASRSRAATLRRPRSGRSHACP